MLLKGLEYENPLEYNKYAWMFFSLAHWDETTLVEEDINVFLTVGNVLKELRVYTDLMVMLYGL